MSRDFGSIEGAMASLTGVPAWGLVRTTGSMFFLEAGQPLPQGNRKNPRGEWHFLIEMCHWRFASPESIIVGSEDDPELIDRIFSQINLGLIDEIGISTPSRDLHLSFSSGLVFSTFTTSASATDQWTQWQLFCPDDNVWIVDGGGHLVSRNAHEQPA